MERGVALVALVGLVGCSLILSEDPDNDGGVPTGPRDASAFADASTTPALCARQAYMRDDFNDLQLDPVLWDFDSAGISGTAEGNGFFTVSFGTNPGIVFFEIFTDETYEPVDAELVADFTSMTFTDDTDLSLTAAIETKASTRTIEAGQLGELVGDFGVLLDGSPRQIPLGAGGFGRWRIRRDGTDVHVERSLPNTAGFQVASSLTDFTASGPMTVRLNARSRDAAVPFSGNFNFVELTGAPDGGWCDFGQFAYLPSRGETGDLFEEITIDGGQISTGNNVLLEAAAGGDVAQLRSRARFNFDNFGAVIRVLDASGLGDAAASVIISRSNLQQFGVSISGGVLGTFARDGMPSSATHGAFDPATNGYVRISHLGGLVRFESSPDGASWVLLRDYPVSFPVNAVELRLEARAEGGNAHIRVERVIGE